MFSPTDNSQEQSEVFKDSLCFVLRAARAKSTSKKYDNAFKAWEVWCHQNRVKSLPCEPLDISKYFIHLYHNNAPYSRIESAFYGIKWYHDCIPCVNCNPCDCKFIRIVLQGMKKLLSKPICKKEPITPEILSAIVANFGHASSKLIHIRLCSMFLLAFAGFFRYDEISNLQRCDVINFKSHIQIFVSKSKTDIYREGAWVIVAATGSSLCPVTMLNRYLVLANMTDETDEGYLFRPLYFSKKSGEHKTRPGKLSYTRCREMLIEALTAVGVDPRPFGFHSLRSGGATAAANRGVPDRLFKKQGRWRSETAKDGYVKDSLESRDRKSVV